MEIVLDTVVDTSICKKKITYLNVYRYTNMLNRFYIYVPCFLCRAFYTFRS